MKKGRDRAERGAQNGIEQTTRSLAIPREVEKDCVFHADLFVFYLPSPSLNGLCWGIPSTLPLESEDCILLAVLALQVTARSSWREQRLSEAQWLRGSEPSDETSSGL